MSRGAGEASEAASGGQPEGKPRTWLPMALWSAALLAGLALIAFIAAVMLPLRRTHQVLSDLKAGAGIPCEEPGGVTDSVRLLGGEERTAGRLNLYLIMPDWLSPYSGDKQRFNAYVLLVNCGPLARPAISRFLGSQDESVRCDAVESLGWYPAAATRELPTLTAMLTDSYPKVRALTAETIGRLGPDGAPAVTALAGALSDSDEWVRREAASAIGNIGPASGASVEALVRAIKVDDWEVAICASWALGKIGPSATAAIPAAERMIKSSVVNERRLAVRIWGRLGSLAKGSIPALETALRDSHPWVRKEAAEALSWWGASAKPAVPALIEALDDQHTRYWATRALGNIGPEARPAKAALEKLIEGADRDFAEVVIETLDKIRIEESPK